MDIIFGRDNAERLREKYTVLDLETVEMEGKPVEVFCLVPAEKINFQELPQLESWVKLHNDFLHGYQTKQWNYCRQALEHLMGKFGGELDSFYEEIEKRINQADPVAIVE